MDPFTTILSGIIGKKAIDAASNNSTVRDVTNKAVNSIITGANEAGQKVEQVANDTYKGVIGVLRNILGKNKTRPMNEYETIVQMGINNGKVLSDGQTQEILDKIKGNTSTTTSPSTTASSSTTTEPTTLANSVKEDESDVVTYTYKPGDTFGQVLLDLGLSDGSRLWGSGGDVEFYTQQLKAQDMLDSRGNVKLGIPFKLRRRK